MGELRPAYLPVAPVSRTTYQPGEPAQCDLWFPEADFPLGYGQTGRPPVLVMVSGYSRVIAARMPPSRRSGDLTDGHWRLLTVRGAVPRILVRDNEAGVGKNRVTSEFGAFAGLLAARIYQGQGDTRRTLPDRRGARRLIPPRPSRSSAARRRGTGHLRPHRPGPLVPPSQARRRRASRGLVPKCLRNTFER
ncbi:hypothetical protein GCM10009540_21110 [Streptomyces turgidiscabies]